MSRMNRMTNAERYEEHQARECVTAGRKNTKRQAARAERFAEHRTEQLIEQRAQGQVVTIAEKNGRLWVEAVRTRSFRATVERIQGCLQGFWNAANGDCTVSVPIAEREALWHALNNCLLPGTVVNGPRGTRTIGAAKAVA